MKAKSTISESPASGGYRPTWQHCPSSQNDHPQDSNPVTDLLPFLSQGWGRGGGKPFNFLGKKIEENLGQTLNNGNLWVGRFRGFWSIFYFGGKIIIKIFSKLKVSPSGSVKATTPFGELTTLDLGCLMSKKISPSTTRKETNIEIKPKQRKQRRACEKRNPSQVTFYILISSQKQRFPIWSRYSLGTETLD